MTTPSAGGPVTIEYYSDVLCVWAYAGHRRVEELAATFAGQVRIRPRFCSVFSDAWTKIEGRWGPDDPFDAFAAHVQEAGARFDHIALHADLWRRVRPRSSAGAHLFLKAVDLWERRANGAATDATAFTDRLLTRADWTLRNAFFADGLDIGDARVHRAVARNIGLDYDALCAPDRLHDAAAALVQDLDAAQAAGVKGSPTFIMNGGRQVLFGNVGYRLLEANVQEWLRAPGPDDASWC